MVRRRNDLDNPFYRPLWRRIAIVVVVAGWFAFEMLVGHDPLWQVVAGGLLAYAIWFFLLRYHPPGDEPPAGLS